MSGVGLGVDLCCCLVLHLVWGFCPFYSAVFASADWCFIHVGSKEVKYENTALAQGVSFPTSSIIFTACTA